MAARKTANPLARVLDALAKQYGEPELPRGVAGPFEWILRENVAYLADDERRARSFAALKREFGTRSRDILSAPASALAALASGVQPAESAQKLKRCAQIAEREHGGDPAALLALETKAALRGLRKYPGIGVPGAEKILLFCGAAAIPALESNGLRALLRLGYGREQKSYGATYLSVREAILPLIERDRSWLVRMHLLLRRHGQELCKRSSPDCDACPATRHCAWFAADG